MNEMRLPDDVAERLRDLVPAAETVSEVISRFLKEHPQEVADAVAKAIRHGWQPPRGNYTGLL